jgi:hypothetical protein
LATSPTTAQAIAPPVPDLAPLTFSVLVTMPQSLQFAGIAVIWADAYDGKQTAIATAIRVPPVSDCG